MKITELTKRSLMFTVPENADGFVNMNLILGENYNYIIDTGMGESNVNEMLKYINDSKPIIAIITHAHFDHILGNSALKDSLIISHRLCWEIIDKGWDTKIKSDLVKHSAYIDSKVYKHLPNLLFESRMHFPEDGITLFHTPGHSDDGISIYDAVDKALYVGDNFGVFDGVAYLWADDPLDAKQYIEQYKQYDFDICVPSHSAPQSREVIGLLEKALEKELKSE